MPATLRSLDQLPREALEREKRSLQVTLRRYEREFERAFQRKVGEGGALFTGPLPVTHPPPLARIDQVRYRRDIAPVAAQYQQYKVRPVLCCSPGACLERLCPFTVRPTWAPSVAIPRSGSRSCSRDDWSRGMRALLCCCV